MKTNSLRYVIKLPPSFPILISDLKILMFWSRSSMIHLAILHLDECNPRGDDNGFCVGLARYSIWLSLSAESDTSMSVQIKPVLVSMVVIANFLVIPSIYKRIKFFTWGNYMVASVLKSNYAFTLIFFTFDDCPRYIKIEAIICPYSV